jgi:hypothetical protein
MVLSRRLSLWQVWQFACGACICMTASRAVADQLGSASAAPVTQDARPLTNLHPSSRAASAPLAGATASHLTTAAHDQGLHTYSVPDVAIATKSVPETDAKGGRVLQQAKSSSRANGTAAAEAAPPEELAPFAGCGTQDVQCLQANRPSCPARAYQGYDGFTCPAGQYCAKASLDYE